MTQKYYVGCGNGKRTVIRTDTPTEARHGASFAALIGPFRTKRAADLMARYGGNNPHLQTVADAERMAR